MKYGEVNEFYFLYGFDRKKFRDSARYVPYRVFRKRRDLLNVSSRFNYLGILRNKALFGIFAEALHFRTARTLGVYRNGVVYDAFAEKHMLDNLLQEHPKTFFKPVDAECGVAVFALDWADGVRMIDNVAVSSEELRRKLEKETGWKREFIIQDRVVQHPELSRIHDKSINTIRLVTVIDPTTGEPVVFAGVLRVGVGNMHVDNWAQGGIMIPFDMETGELGKYGFYKPGKGTRTDRHPDSGFIFGGYVIPYYGQIVEQALRFHAFLRDIHSIGWDIAVTPEGPLFIEGNDNWEISLHQCYHGVYDAFERLFKRSGNNFGAY